MKKSNLSLNNEKNLTVLEKLKNLTSAEIKKYPLKILAGEIKRIIMELDNLD